jgi:heterotetrameric sarcosine oxidase gamma subunit
VAEPTIPARSPIEPVLPAGVVAGWAVSVRRAGAPLTLTDWTPVAKVVVRAAAGGPVAQALGVPFGRAGRDPEGTLVVGCGPGEWLLLAPPGRAPALVERWQDAGGGGDGLVSVIDATSGRALVRLAGAGGAVVLAKVCALDLAGASDGAAFRTSVAGVVTEVIGDGDAFLLACDRSFGRYLWEALLDAGREFAIAVDGFSPEDHEAKGR